MEAAPPSYEKATLVNRWDIIADYLPSRDLCAVCLVCSTWHRTFVPYLWGNPASHFGTENDAVYVALTRFKRTLRISRLLVRSLTHTLHLPPAHPELYDGPHAEWLREILERLPSLQSLIVRGLPFFDHAALQALRYVSQRGSTPTPVMPDVAELPASTVNIARQPPMVLCWSNLRLLDASRCPNITSHGLAQALGRFESLMYLDLSFTYPARDPLVLATTKILRGLQVLKLRGLSLRDDALEILSKSIRLRVRSLDVRDNLISDRGIRSLLSHCFVNAQFLPSRSGQRSPSLLPYLGSEMLEIYQGEDFEGYLRNAFTDKFISRLAIEDVPDGGITHLYIAGNQVTVEGVSGLLRSERLHVLDAGAVKGEVPAPLPASEAGEQVIIAMPGAQKLTPVVASHAASTLTFLRIDHSLITKDTPTSLSNTIVPGRIELGDTSKPAVPSVAELNAVSIRPEYFELDAEPQSPRFELPGNAVDLRLRPTAEGCNVVEGGIASDPRRGSALAPEALPCSADDVDNEAMLSPVPNRERGSSSGAGPSLASAVGYFRSNLPMASERKARLNAHVVGSHSLHPAMIPHVTTLVLTDVPPFFAHRDVVDRLILFIKQCAEEAAFARRQAKLDYSVPPGRRGHATALKHSAEKVFALKRLVLELAPEAARRPMELTSRWRHTQSKSLTEDRDSEALWTASETDFSFFGDEECGLPSLDPGQLSFHSGSTEKEVSSAHPTPAVHPLEQPKFDTVSLISSFRKERKLAYQRNFIADNIERETEGFWDGLVQVVRWNQELRSDEEMDYYGNQFRNR